MRGALVVFAPRAAATFETRRWIESSRRDKFVLFPPKPTKMSKRKKRKEVSRGPESSIDAMLLMKVQSRTETPR
jgi:hypothetical protein